MKTILLTGPTSALRTLIEVIQLYADAAYPVGGSECAQTARAGLLDTAENIKQQVQLAEPVGSADSDQKGAMQVTISRRIKSHIKAAIQYYQQTSSEPSGPSENRSQLLLAMLNGTAISNSDWQE